LRIIQFISLQIKFTIFILYVGEEINIFYFNIMLHGILLATTISTFVQVIKIFNSRMGFNRIILVIFTKLPLLIFYFQTYHNLQNQLEEKCTEATVTLGVIASNDSALKIA
jgi:hypothetical protein